MALSSSNAFEDTNAQDLAASEMELKLMKGHRKKKEKHEKNQHHRENDKTLHHAPKGGSHHRNESTQILSKCSPKLKVENSRKQKSFLSDSEDSSDNDWNERSAQSKSIYLLLLKTTFNEIKSS